MQYLLTEAEYQALKYSASVLASNQQKLTQEFCTLVSDKMPIIFSWCRDADPRPWGCILTKKQGYCDECPAREFCPYPNKSWSK